jgi:hypothetical protein
VADINWIASRSLFKTIHRIVLPPLADTPHRDDGCEGCACGGHASLRDDGCEGCASGGHASLRDDGVGLFQYSIDGIYLILI